ncbi:MAG: rod shape-determining protein MreD [Anaerohalosphaera sp.]|nr:rod shape-determining protein MreD [Anaerohalosphaera sp.]
MRWFTFITILIIITVVNAANALNFIAVGPLNVRPDLLIITLVFFAVNSNSRDAIIASFLIGFAVDCSTTAPMGLYMICFGVTGAIASRMKREWFEEMIVSRFVIIFVISIAIHALAALIAPLNQDGNGTESINFLCLQSLYTALAGALLWYLFAAAAPIFGIERSRT